MLTRKTVGKIQLILAGILLLAGIIGAIYACSAYSQLINKRSMMTNSLTEGLSYIKNFSSSESRYIATLSIVNTYQQEVFFDTEVLIMVFGFSMLSIVISLILILEGLLNIPQK